MATRTVACVLGCATGLRLFSERNFFRPARSALDAYHGFAAAVLFIYNFAVVDRDIEVDASAECFPYDCTIALKAVLCYCEKDATQRIKIGNGRSIGVNRGFVGSGLLLSTHRTILTMRVPSWKVVGLRQTAEVITHIGIMLRPCLQNHVVY